ncbi:MAG: hypothetical protein J6Y92_06145 [Lentisphaeria bacterium]|nr:hypothetical protein [Lentisphaeria bacterium]
MPDTKGSGSQRLEKVRRNMLRMTSPAGFGDDGAKEFGSLSAINVPPWLARADAAYDRAVRLIQDSTPPGSSAPAPTIRLEYWRTVRTLLEESEENLASIHHVFEKAEEIPLDVSVYLAFVRFLLRLVMQIAMAARSGVELAADARSFPSPLFPARFQDTLTDAEAVFTASEGRIRQFAIDSLALTSSAVDKIRSDCRKALPKVAKERYDRAFAAFTDHFSHFGEDTSA